MIYLIDDKKDRQHKDFGWSDVKFAQYVDFIKPLYSIEEIVQIGENLYNDKNIILYHESFLDFTNDSRKALEQRMKLQNITEAKTELAVAFFSGSQSSRSLDKNKAYLPVAVLYQNLEILVKQHIQGCLELKYLLFGQNPEIESQLNEIQNQANRAIEIDAAQVCGKTLFIYPDEDFIQNPISNAVTEEIYQTKDTELSHLISEFLDKAEYDYIFIPLCFGPTLSDYNGLRLATHIRCTPSRSQLTRIFIYSFVGLEYLVDHEYFNILKSKNVELVSYSKKSFELAANKVFEPLLPYELSKEIKKLKLDPPLNYADSHSIANEWAIHQWVKTIGCDETQELTKIFQNVQTNLYFKYLKTIHPVSELNRISPDKLKINYDGEPKVLLIDDEAEKGWYEFFAYLLGDLNDVYIDYLGIDFKKFTSDGIIEQSIEKIFKDDIDIVILDFRLNYSDYHKSSEQITSVKLLKKIKEINPGVQVIAFSATNKVLNLQALQDAGADGFILKDGGENAYQSIENLLVKLTTSIKKALWLKQLSENFSKIVNDCPNSEITFKRSLKSNLKISFELIEKSFTQAKYLNYAYLQIFLCIEDFLRLKSIFEFGDKCYVNQNILTHKKLDEKRWNSILKYHPSFNNTPSYFTYEENEVRQPNITTDFKMSCVLVFLFNNHNSNVFNWPEIRDIRNKKAAHPERENVNQGEINEIVTFILKVLNCSNFQVPTRNGLNDEIDPNSLAALKMKFQ
jgi:CheY-like chemotaxis protein